jgi:hypothetical protein
MRPGRRDQHVPYRKGGGDRVTGSGRLESLVGSVGHSAQVFAPRHLIKAPRKEFKIISNLVVFIHWQDA